MAKILNFYEEISSIFGRVFKKNDIDVLTDAQFLNLSSEKKLRIRELVNELMTDRNKLFPSGYGADSVDVGLMPDIELPRWSSLVLDTEDSSPLPTTVLPTVAIDSDETPGSASGVVRRYGPYASVGHQMVRQATVAYGADAVYFGAYASKLLQEGNRLFSDQSKRRFHARIVSRKKAAFIKELQVFRGRAGPDFDKLNPHLAVAMRALVQKVESKVGSKVVKGTSVEASKSNWVNMNRAKVSVKSTAQH